MTDAESIDRQVDELYRKHADDDHSQRVDVGGASITQIGVSEKTFVALIVAPMLLGLLVAIWALHDASDAKGQAALAANNAQLSERNAKLAQYQLKLALDRAKIEVPDDLTENNK